MSLVVTPPFPRDGNAAHYLDGTGALSTPAGGGGGADPILTGFAALGSAVKGYAPWAPVSGTTQTLTLSSQTALYYAMYVPTAATITGVKWAQQTLGSYTANNNNQVGLFTYSAGTLTQVAASTNDGTLWQTAASNTWGTKAFSATYSAAAGLFYVGILYCSSAQTTAPALMCASPTGDGIWGIDFTNSSHLTGALGSTTVLPASVAFSSIGTKREFPCIMLY